MLLLQGSGARLGRKAQDRDSIQSLRAAPAPGNSHVAESHGLDVPFAFESIDADGAIVGRT